MTLCQFVRVVEHGHGLLTGHVRKAVEAFVKTKAAFQIGEKAVHRNSRPGEARRATQPLQVYQIGTSGGKLNDAADFIMPLLYQNVTNCQRRNQNPLKCQVKPVMNPDTGHSIKNPYLTRNLSIFMRPRPLRKKTSANPLQYAIVA
jgi:hypothetical protein